MIIANEIIRSGTGGGEALTDSEADGSLDEEEENDDADATPSIEQTSTRSSSDPPTGGEGAATLWAEAGADDEALTTFAYFVVCANDGSTLVGLFYPDFILSTPAFVAPWAPSRPAASTFVTIAPLIAH
jgi:hypothetical protein